MKSIEILNNNIKTLQLEIQTKDKELHQMKT